MENLERVLRAHPFLSGLEPAQVSFLVGCAKNVRFRPGEFLIREGDRETTLYLIRQGTVSIELHGTGGDAVCVETVGAGDVLGVSRLAPGAAHLDCRARETVLAFAIDNECLLAKMEHDPRLGLAICRRLLERTYDRLSRARLQNLDIYQ